MYCKSCGAVVSDNDRYCKSCGSKVETNPVSQFYNDNNNSNNFNNYAVPEHLNSSLTLGILSLVFSILNYLTIPFVHLVGIVLGIIAVSFANKDKQTSGVYSKAGFGLAIAGIVLGVLAAVLGAVYANQMLN